MALSNRNQMRGGAVACDCAHDIWAVGSHILDGLLVMPAGNSKRSSYARSSLYSEIFRWGNFIDTDGFLLRKFERSMSILGKEEE